MAASPVSDDQRKTRLGSFVAGLSALINVFPAPAAPIRYPHRSEAEALMGDGIRIGDDMRRVMERERAREQASAE